MLRITRAASRYRRRHQGFSLLEMLVAVAILGISLSVLYEVVGGATKIVRVDQKYAYAVELGQSLIANYSVVPTAGLKQSGRTAGGFSWRVDTNAVLLDPLSTLPEGSLQALQVQVSWTDGEKQREVVLNTVVAGMDEPEYL